MAVTRRAALEALAVTAVGVATGAAVHGYAYERYRFQVTRADLPVNGLPPGLRGLRVGFLTDVHHGPFFSQEDVSRAGALLSAERPDLIVLGGDYVNWQDRVSAGACAEALAGLEAPHGVFAVLGNHDDERATHAALERNRIAVLRDERTAVLVKGDLLEIAGLRYWTRGLRDVQGVVGGAAGCVLLAAHDPRRLTEAAALGLPAVLSGHTHGGQVVLPLVGAIAAQKFPVVAGLGRLKNTSLFVSRGVGTVGLPLRVNCPPEVAVLTLVGRSEP